MEEGRYIMASWDEHAEIQGVLNIILSQVTTWVPIFFIVGVLQHLIVDNLINERPVNLYGSNEVDEIMSLLLNLAGVVMVLLVTSTLGGYIALLGCLLPDILEGLRLVLSGDGKGLWMKGDSQKFHVQLPFDYLIDTRNDYQKDINRRIIFIVVFIVFFTGVYYEK